MADELTFRDEAAADRPDEVEGILADIDTDRGDCTLQDLDMMLLPFGAFPPA